ncbi:hypothetical protein Bca4012_076684 [Brassica carinata]
MVEPARGRSYREKLDRALINSDWLRCFPDSYAQFEAGGISDHARCLIRLSATTKAMRKPFRFFNFLTEREEFLPTVAKLWESTETLFHSRASLGLFHKKLKALKFEMRALNRNHYGDLPNRTKQEYEVMCECQNQVLIDPNPLTFAAAVVASDRWNKLARIEEKIHRQKSCIRWLQAGDLNTTFFHRSVQARASWNVIRVLQTANGEILTTTTNITRGQYIILSSFYSPKIKMLQMFLSLYYRNCSLIGAPLLLQVLWWLMCWLKRSKELFILCK